MAEETFASFYLKKCEILVFRNAVSGIGDPKFVRFRFNEEGTAMIMEPFDRMTLSSFRVNYSRPSSPKMRVYSKQLCDIICFKMAWNATSSYRIPGKILPGQKIVLFDLTKAVTISEEGR